MCLTVSGALLADSTWNPLPRTRPSFYRGIYVNYYSAENQKRLASLIKNASGAGVNVFVVDVQPSANGECPIPANHVAMIREADIHPVARIVCFDRGLTKLPVEAGTIESIYQLAEASAKAGFKEIQLDYIRFADTLLTTYHGKDVALDPEIKYAFIKSLIGGASERVKSYEVVISADIFGRIPWVSPDRHDVIGQRMEVFDSVCDVICPMAYPSHYCDSYQNTPYRTVYSTSVKARMRATRAEIVSYIQSFRMNIEGSGLPYDEYIRQQLDAVHNAGISGFILWNARSDYEVAFGVMRAYYMIRTQ